MLRTSSYCIYVDLPGNKQEMLLVHGYTGAYDKVSRAVATYVRSLEIGRPPKPLYGDWSPEPCTDEQPPIPADQVIETLRQRGLFDGDGPSRRRGSSLHGGDAPS